MYLVNILYDLVGLKKFPDKIIKRMRCNYLREAEIIDTYIGELVAYLKKINQYDNSLLIITSDHGQALKEKNFIGHSLFLYNEIIEIPLIVKFPNNKKIKIGSGYQSLVDLKHLMENSIQGNYIDITKEKVFSESWGYQYKIDEKIKQFDKGLYGVPRKAIYKNGYKMVINNKGEIEELLFNGKNLQPPDHKIIVDDLINDLQLFRGTENFIIEKIHF